MRIVLPEVTPQGFGSNFITLAKAWLIAKVCDMEYQKPVWPFSEHVKPATPNGFGYYFPTTRTEAIRYRLLSYQFRIHNKLRTQFLWPTLSFKRDHYYNSGITDMGKAAELYLHKRHLDDPSRSVVMRVSGMWGGYNSIVAARDWVRNLMLSHEDTCRRLESILWQTQNKMRIAVHIRTSEAQGEGSIRGKWLVRLPLDWYIRLCHAIQEQTDCHIILVTDGTEEDVGEFLDEVDPVHIIGEPYQDLLGALLMAESDLVICSNSTYSRLGCFLNDKPYIWPADVLFKDSSRRFGYLWNHRQNPLTQPEDRTDEWSVRRAFAIPLDFRTLPPGLRLYLNSGGTLPVEIHDDLLYRDAVYIHT